MSPAIDKVHRNAVRAMWQKGTDKGADNSRKRRLSQRAKRDAVINDAKSKPCKDCDIEYPYYVMDFDHVRGEKVCTINSLKGRTQPLVRILEEIAKCDVVCANCHRERTHKRRVESL